MIVELFPQETLVQFIERTQKASFEQICSRFGWCERMGIAQIKQSMIAGEIVFCEKQEGRGGFISRIKAGFEPRIYQGDFKAA